MFLLPAIIPLALVLAPSQSPADTFRRHYEAAEALRRAGNVAAAEAEYTAILAEAYHKMGRVATAAGDHRAALDALETAAGYRADDPAVLVDLAIARYNLGQYQQALAPLERVLARDARNAAARHMLGKSRFMLGEFDKAAAELEAATKLSPKDYDATYTLGLAYLKQRQLEPARRVFGRMIAALGDRPQLRVLIGRGYRETGFLAEAIDEFKRAAALDPRFPRVHYYLGLTYLLKDGTARTADAAAEFEIELAAHPDEYFANYYLGILATIDREWDKAVRYLEKAASIQPENPDPYFHLGHAYQGLERHERALEVLGRCVELTTDPTRNDYQVATAHYRIGQSLLKLGRTDEAEKALKVAADLKSAALRNDERKTEAYLKAENLQQQQEMLGASAAGEGVGAPPAEREPPSGAQGAGASYYAKVVAAAHNSIGLLRAERGDFRAAADHFGLAVRWNPEQEGLNFNLGLARFKVEQYAQAVAPLESELAAHPENLAAKRLLGLCYFGAKQYERASAVLGELVAVRPGDVALYYPLALALAKQGREEESSRAIQQMVAVGGDTPQVHLLLGQAYSDQGNTAKALEELKAALALDPKVPEAHFFMGVIHLKLGSFDEAVRAFEAELAVSPGDTRTMYHLGYALLARQDTERGVRTLREVVAARPDHADARFELGKALLQQGDVAGALEHLEAAAKLDPEKAHVHYQLGRAYIAAGRQTEGERHLETSKRLKEEAREPTAP